MSNFAFLPDTFSSITESSARSEDYFVDGGGA